MKDFRLIRGGLAEEGRGVKSEESADARGWECVLQLVII